MVRFSYVLRVTLALIVASATNSVAQESSGESSAATSQAISTEPVPRMFRFSGSVKDISGKPVTGVAGVTFALYKEQEGGATLWLETQSVHLDAFGHYIVMLGASKAEGLPTELFSSGEARWLGVQPEGQAEQPRVLLLSVPYALKAADSETLGGFPSSAFVLAAPSLGITTGSAASSSAGGASAPPAGSVTGSGTTDFVPLWTSSSNLGNSVLFQSGSGSTAKVGINTTAPAATLDVKGGMNVQGLLNLPATGTGTSNAGKNSQAQDFVASSFSSSASKAVNQTFQWRAEPAGNNTSTPSGTLNLLFGSGTSSPAETGVRISSKGLFTFAIGQTFPGTGTITGVTAGTDLTGGGASGTVTLNLDTTKVPLLNGANTFVGNQTLTGNLSDTGNISATGSITGQTGSFVGNTGLFTSLLSAVQSGAGSAVTGFASATTGSAVGVSGQSSSTSGVGVSGEGGTGVLGIGYVSSGGTGVLGSGKYGVQGTSSVASGVGGVFNNTASGESLSARINGTEMLGVYSGGTLVSGGDLLVGSNGITALMGDPQCGPNFVGISLYGNWSNCAAYSMIGDTSGNLYLNRKSGGSLYFRENNGTEMTLGPGGAMAITSSSMVDGLPSSAIYASSNNSGGGGSFIGGHSASGFSAGAGILAEGGNATNSANSGAGGLFYGGSNTDSSNSGADGIDATAGNLGTILAGWAGNFAGSVNVSDTIFAASKNFKIDHPLDPANKYLYHASVESSEMMNIYTGNVTTDSQGEATVQLAQWFEALNTDFRYQLTVIGQFAQAIVGSEIAGAHFTIKTDKPNVKVSWQITGVRQDAYAKAHPLVVEQEKGERLHGFYIHPELHGAPEEKQIEWALHPELMKRMKEHRAMSTASTTHMQPLRKEQQLSADLTRAPAQ